MEKLEFTCWEFAKRRDVPLRNENPLVIWNKYKFSGRFLNPNDKLKIGLYGERGRFQISYILCEEEGAGLANELLVVETARRIVSVSKGHTMQRGVLYVLDKDFENGAGLLGNILNYDGRAIMCAEYPLYNREKADTGKKDADNKPIMILYSQAILDFLDAVFGAKNI